jgi:hypothetical protein
MLSPFDGGSLLLDTSQYPEAPNLAIEQDTDFIRLWEALQYTADPEYLSAYENAFKYLHWIYVLSQIGEEVSSLRRKLLVFPSRVSSFFLSLLEISDASTLVITAHFLG